MHETKRSGRGAAITLALLLTAGSALSEARAQDKRGDSAMPDHGAGSEEGFVDEVEQKRLENAQRAAKAAKEKKTATPSSAEKSPREKDG